jgi:hypothetical protein
MASECACVDKCRGRSEWSGCSIFRFGGREAPGFFCSIAAASAAAGVRVPQPAPSSASDPRAAEYVQRSELGHVASPAARDDRRARRHWAFAAHAVSRALTGRYGARRRGRHRGIRRCGAARARSACLLATPFILTKRDRASPRRCYIFTPSFDCRRFCFSKPVPLAHTHTRLASARGAEQPPSHHAAPHLALPRMVPAPRHRLSALCRVQDRISNRAAAVVSSRCDCATRLYSRAGLFFK